ncbi:MAG: ABC transporter ATP-binding protein [Saprospiraceae bacterium]
MELLSSPDVVEKNRWLAGAYNFFQFESPKQMLIYFGISILILIGVTNLISMFAIWIQFKYSWDIAHELSVRLLNTYLKKPYSYYLNNNSGNLKTYIISEVNSLTGGVIIPIIVLFSRSFVSIIIFLLLIKVDPKIALIMFGGLGSAYLLIYLSQKNILKNIGEHRIAMNLLRYKNLGELFEGIKTVTVYNQHNFFYSRFSHASKEFCGVQPKYNFILAAPKYILEFLAFGSILSITIYLFINSGDIQKTIPRLSLYAVAGYRLLPALQKAFAAAAKLRHSLPVLDKLYDDLILSLGYDEPSQAEIKPLQFNDQLQLSNIHFTYENTKQPIIENLSINISKGQTIAFVGSTGSGKTTLVDIIVGLLHPSKGEVKVDKTTLQPNEINAWWASLAYVPQDVFLFDDTVLKNIVLGIPEENIDLKHLEIVTKMADIYDFIQEEMPEGFQTKIGERGVRLSGGQRQRLGLARALYSNPSVLVLDEATSALDSITENGIIESLKSLPKNITTIIIAHRLSTVRHADYIYFLEEGKITAHGNYDTLVNASNTFKTMVKFS